MGSCGFLPLFQKLTSGTVLDLRRSFWDLRGSFFGDFSWFLRPLPHEILIFMFVQRHSDTRKSTSRIGAEEGGLSKKHDVFLTPPKREILKDFLYKIRCEFSTVSRFSSVLLLLHLPQRLRRPENQSPESHELRGDCRKNAFFVVFLFWAVFSDSGWAAAGGPHYLRVHIGPRRGRACI